MRLIRPYIAFADVEADIRAVFDSGMFTRGANVAAFAGDLARYTGAGHAFPTTSATTALSLTLAVLKIGPGDEVAVSDYSFPATANVVETAGARPVFCDVDPDTWNMDPDCLVKRLGPKTRAVIFVDGLGNPTGLHRVRDLCRERGLPLIEDAACALGSAEQGERCGRVADLTCFSFHPRKLLTTGEGGAVTTDDPALAERLGLLLNHGGETVDGRPDFTAPGFNYRMSEIQALMGRAQLPRLDAIIGRRRALLDRCAEAFAPLGLRAQAVGPDVVHNVQSMAFAVPQGMDRDGLIRHLAGRGVESTIGTYCLSGTKFYREKYRDVQPNAERLQATTITLPCHDEVDADRLIAAVTSFAGRGRGTKEERS
ncbi:DegT/DnrJ/EryC1/StrS family aminotransferase [Pseudodesulfovibrio mercurii]|nr:DegT/DnrJ/EryC1/StrS family aminotransferase [Pseudodesulfovibrio mercurii]